MENYKLIASLVAGLIGLILVSLKLIDYSRKRKEKNHSNDEIIQNTFEGKNSIKLKKGVNKAIQINNLGDNEISVGE